MSLCYEAKITGVFCTVVIILNFMNKYLIICNFSVVKFSLPRQFFGILAVVNLMASRVINYKGISECFTFDL